MRPSSSVHPLVSPERLRILLADDHPMIRAGLATIISREPTFEMIGEAVTGLEAVTKTCDLRPHVVLMDLRMPDLGGIAAITEIRKIDKAVHIIIFTTSSAEEDIYRGLRAGARAYLLKDASFEEVIQCIKVVASGRRHIPHEVAEKLAQRLEFQELSDRELKILEFLASGKSNKKIAQMAGIGEGTVKFHINNICSKLSAESRTEAVTIAARRGLIEMDYLV